MLRTVHIYSCYTLIKKNLLHIFSPWSPTPTHKHHSWTHQEHIQITISTPGRKWLTLETTHFTQQLVPLLASTAIQRVAISRFQLFTDSLISWPTADFKPLFSWQSWLLPGGSVCSTGNWKQIVGFRSGEWEVCAKITEKRHPLKASSIFKHL
jgi:hypothetical protein